jgi:hypothetical protein
MGQAANRRCKDTDFRRYLGKIAHPVYRRATCANHRLEPQPKMHTFGTWTIISVRVLPTADSRSPGPDP